MAADRRKGRRFLPQSLLRSSPTSASLVPVGSGGPSEPHGTCSSGQELAGGVRPGLGPTSPRIPPPTPRDSLLGGRGEAKAEFRGRAQRLDLQPWGEGSWGRGSRGESCSGAVQPPWSGAVALLSSGSEGRAGLSGGVRRGLCARCSLLPCGAAARRFPGVALPPSLNRALVVRGFAAGAQLPEILPPEGLGGGRVRRRLSVFLGPSLPCVKIWS